MVTPVISFVSPVGGLPAIPHSLRMLTLEGLV